MGRLVGHSGRCFAFFVFIFEFVTIQILKYVHLMKIIKSQTVFECLIMLKLFETIHFSNSYSFFPICKQKVHPLNDIRMQ